MKNQLKPKFLRDQKRNNILKEIYVFMTASKLFYGMKERGLSIIHSYNLTLGAAYSSLKY